MSPTSQAQGVFDAHAKAHALSIDQIADALQTSAKAGLSEEGAKARLVQYGPNVLTEAPGTPLWKRIGRQFTSLLIGILIAAAIISGLMGEWIETIAILLIVFINGLIGFFQEERAERALASLRSLTAPSCRVTRDGVEHNIPAAELVPGDLFHVEAGDHIPADARLVESARLRTQEAALTGESTTVAKTAHTVLQPDAPLADRQNMIHAGTTVSAGTAHALVVGTAMNTELGRIAGMLQQSPSEPTPLQRRLAAMGRYLVGVCLILVAVIFALNTARGHDPFEVFLFSVSLAVAAVPEGLPAVVTVALALGVHRMARRQALVRHLPAVETLGCVTVICSDKTGTLTRNEMTVKEIWTLQGRYEVSGVGYSREGDIRRSNDAPNPDAHNKEDRVRATEEPDLRQLITIGTVCNNARIDTDSGKDVEIIGDPTEAALRVLAAKAGLDESDFHRLHEIPFDSQRKAMSVVVDAGQRTLMFSKGASEAILDRCTHSQLDGEVVPLGEGDGDSIRRAAAEMGHRALRVLAMAWKEVPKSEARDSDEDGLIFVGLVGMIDPPRMEARDAVDHCRRAGIRPVMITGDHPETAMAVAKELTLMDEVQSALTGTDLDLLDDETLTKEIEQTAVFARVSAEHKLRLVRALRTHGHVVAMTGDGVNDAPAVKAADIGVAMGKTGTDVTRGASDMVLLDDNFASIVAAVEEGRGIFDNIQKVTHFLLSCNAGELILLFFAALIGWPAPLLAVQILWINLITDGVPALALGVEPPERDIMRRMPRSPGDPLIGRMDALSILGHGMLIATVSAGTFAWHMRDGDSATELARAATFSVAAFSQLFFAIGCRSRRYTMPEIGWFSNPPLFWAIAISALLQIGVSSLPQCREFLQTAPLSLRQWVFVILISLIPVSIIETIKLVRAAIRQPNRLQRLNA